MYCTKESDPTREPDQEMKGAEQLQVKWLRIFWHQMALVKKDQWIFKISCVILENSKSVCLLEKMTSCRYLPHLI